MLPIPTKLVPKNEFADYLSQQVDELDLLKSMYPNDGEIILSEKGFLDKINSFINGEVSDYVPNNLDYVINLIIENLKLEVCVNLPLTYPQEIPDVFIRCNQLNRLQESNVNTELASYLKTNHIGEVCVYTAINWLQDNILQLSTITKDQVVETVSNKHSHEADPFTRLWIYSHHIYNKKKREEIIKRSKELQLSGFCLPGKPGIICIEGDESACKEWWQSIKSMKWKKITIRKTETYESHEKLNVRKFRYFEELHFNASNTKHVMAEFSKFMSKHGFSDIFADFFGLN